MYRPATFVGYILGGALEAAVATIGIFLPSFFYIVILAPVRFGARKSVNACAIALMAGVTLQLGTDALRGWLAWLIALTGLVVLLRWGIGAAWVVLGGGIVGLMASGKR